MQDIIMDYRCTIGVVNVLNCRRTIIIVHLIVTCMLYHLIGDQLTRLYRLYSEHVNNLN